MDYCKGSEILVILVVVLVVLVVVMRVEGTTTTTTTMIATTPTTNCRSRGSHPCRGGEEYESKGTRVPPDRFRVVPRTGLARAVTVHPRGARQRRVGVPASASGVPYTGLTGNFVQYSFRRESRIGAAHVSVAFARSKFESFFGFYFSFAFEFANLQTKEFLGRMVWGLTVMVSDSPGTNLSTVASIPRVGGASTTLTTNNNNPLHTCSLALQPIRRPRSGRRVRPTECRVTRTTTMTTTTSRSIPSNSPVAFKVPYLLLAPPTLPPTLPLPT